MKNYHLKFNYIYNILVKKLLYYKYFFNINIFYFYYNYIKINNILNRNFFFILIFFISKSDFSIIIINILYLKKIYYLSIYNNKLK